jgi:hypothetical protein
MSTFIMMENKIMLFSVLPKVKNHIFNESIIQPD